MEFFPPKETIKTQQPLNLKPYNCCCPQPTTYHLNPYLCKIIPNYVTKKKTASRIRKC